MKCALGREHVYLDACQLCYGLTPDAGCIDDEAAMNLSFLSCSVVAQLDTFHYTVLDHKAYDLFISQHFCTMPFGVDDVGCSEAERINRSIGHADGTDKRGVDSRLDALGLLRRDNVGTDACAVTSLDKVLLIVKTVFGKRDEETIGLLYTMTSYPAGVMFSLMHSRADSWSVTA